MMAVGKKAQSWLHELVRRHLEHVPTIRCHTHQVSSILNSIQRNLKPKCLPAVNDVNTQPHGAIFDLNNLLINSTTAAASTAIAAVAK